jgi:PTS system glucose-specific IIC component
MIGFFKNLFSLSNKTAAKSKKTGSSLAQELIEAYGGESNILSVDACITRLRIVVQELGKVDQEKLKSLGAKGVILVGKSAQSVFGTRSEKLKSEIKELLGHKAISDTQNREKDDNIHTSQEAEETDAHEYHKVQEWIAKLGGTENICTMKVCALTRICVELKEPAPLNTHSLQKSGIQAIVRIDDKRYHLLVGLDAYHYTNILKNLTSG